MGVVEHILGTIFRCKGILVSHLDVNCLNSACEFSVIAAASFWHLYLVHSFQNRKAWGAWASWLEVLEVKAEKLVGIAGLLKRNYELDLVVT